LRSDGADGAAAARRWRAPGREAPRLPDARDAAGAGGGHPMAWCDQHGVHAAWRRRLGGRRQGAAMARKRGHRGKAAAGGPGGCKSRRMAAEGPANIRRADN
jgi:hypothetical protein